MTGRSNSRLRTLTRITAPKSNRTRTSSRIPRMSARSADHEATSPCSVCRCDSVWSNSHKTVADEARSRILIALQPLVEELVVGANARALKILATHCARSAVIGSARVARRTGTTNATAAHPTRITTVAPSTVGSSRITRCDGHSVPVTHMQQFAAAVRECIRRIRSGAFVVTRRTLRDIRCLLE